MDIFRSFIPQQRKSRVRGQAEYGARSLDVVDYMGARVAELRALRKAAAALSGNRRVYQQLAWHLRRRTMSHSSHRMPARLLAAHRRELAASNVRKASAKTVAKHKAVDASDFEERPLGPQGKMRCRKYRRRAQFLQAHRRLRAQNPTWLETHIWHAKRFHMDTLPDGRCVAHSPNDRGLRSGYRALAHASLVHDASYLDIIEMRATSKQLVLDLLSHCLCKEDYSRLILDPVLCGARRVDELNILDSTGKTIAPVFALWRPSTHAQLWMWCHPSASFAVATTLENAVSGKEELEVTVVQHEVLTFCVMGPRANAVVTTVMDRVRGVSQGLWKVIRSVRSSACLPQGIVLAYEAEDPRISFPPKRMAGAIKAAECLDDVTEVLSSAFTSVNDSEIWCGDRRREWTQKAKLSNSENVLHVPVICMQRPAGLSRGFGAGWDIVVPAGWGMAFWMSFMYANGGRAAGVREMQHLGLETLLPVFPADFQDTCAGRACMEPVEASLAQAYARRPLSKRVNYAMYRVPWPFCGDWALLNYEGVEFMDNSGQYPSSPSHTSIVSKAAASQRSRPRKKLRTPADDAIGSNPGCKDGQSSACFSDGAYGRADVRVLRSAGAVRDALDLNSQSIGRRYRDSRDPVVEWIKADRAKYRNEEARSDANKVQAACVMSNDANPRIELKTVDLVRVILRPCRKGNLSRNALICMPTMTDAHMISRRGKMCDGWNGPRETLARHAERDGVVYPSRKMIGRVSYGDYSLARGHCVASGVILVSAVRELMECGATVGGGNHRLQSSRRRHLASASCVDASILQVRVLFRNINSLQYRFAIAAIQGR